MMIFADIQTFDIPNWHWGVLVGWFLILLLVDILILHSKDEIPTLKTATVQSLVWIGLGVGLGLVFWPLYGGAAASQYFGGYLLEKSLSIDNVFAWSIMLAYFKIPKKYQHRVLFWGVFGALVMRVIFIFAGVAVLNHFEPALIIFGLILLYSGYKIFASHDEMAFDPTQSRMLKLFKRVIPISHKLDGHKLFTIENGKKVATMLFIAVLAVEMTDLLFAVDSVPAILAISRDPYIVFASNAAAILGLRSLYFVFDKIKDRFWLLNKALGLLLLGVGIKMILSPHAIFGFKWFGIEISTEISLVMISFTLLASMILSSIISNPGKE